MIAQRYMNTPLEGACTVTSHGPMRKKSTDFLLFSMHMFTILITEMEQGQGSVISTERPLRVFFARKIEKS